MAIGILSEKRGDFEQAAVMHRELVVDTERRFGPEHPSLADALVRLGTALWELGELRDALASFERALEIRAKTEGTPYFLAKNRFLIAQLLTELDQDMTRARELALLAKSTLEERSHEVVGEELDAIDAWLREHDD